MIIMPENIIKTENLHSVTLVKEMCKGCTTCIKQCPTGAIRVRGGKAKIIKERCIDCGECIRVCPYHAKQAKTDGLECLNDFKYKVALPAPSMYVQFDKPYSVDTILTGLMQLGFDDVYEVAGGAELVTEATGEYLKEGCEKPVISSACPVITRLMSVRFPNLISNIVPMRAPVDIAAALARRQAMEKTGLSAEDIGVFFISPCPAKATTVKAPIGIEKSDIDVVLAMKDVCLKVAHYISKIENPKKLSRAGLSGVGWAKTEGESSALGGGLNCIAADGIGDCIKLLEAIEDDRLSGVDFVELSACTGGCVGGVLAVENPYIAKNKLASLKVGGNEISIKSEKITMDEIKWSEPVIYKPVLNLDTNIIKAMRKMELMELLYDDLPKIDCGACGSPSCRSFAEDVVRGFANETDCIFKLKKRVHDLAVEMMELESKLSPNSSGGEKNEKD